MEYCGGGAVKDICAILDRPLREDQIAYVCHEALKVRTRVVLPCVPNLNTHDVRDSNTCTRAGSSIATSKAETSW